MSADRDPLDSDLDARLRAAFQATRVPPTPARLRDRVTDLLASGPDKVPRGNWPRTTIGWPAPVAVVVAVGLIGAVLLTSGGAKPSSSPQSSSQAEPSPAASTGSMAGDLFLPGQAAAGDGWRLIAGAVGLRRSLLSFEGDGRIELFSGEGLVKPFALLDIPKNAPPVDSTHEALLVIDLSVGNGPICGQIRFDGVTFDADQHTLTARYTEGLQVSPLPPGVACDSVGIAAAAVVAISRDHLVPGPQALRLERAQSPGVWSQVAELAITAPVLPVPAKDAAVADWAGAFPGGGLWATRGKEVFLSTDGGATWRSATMPVARSPFVLDPTHAWIASAGPGSTDATGSPTDVLNLVVDRTTDGGRTWKRSAVPGNVAGTTPVLALSDSNYGYLLAAGLRFGPGSFVFRTVDGGATWQPAGSLGAYLGSNFGLGPGGSLWAGTQGDAGPVGRPVLDVSRDGGRTWHDARLPGLVGSEFATNVVLGPPRFFGQQGVVAVSVAGADGATQTRLFSTADAGATWTLAATLEGPQDGSTAVAIVDPATWLAPGPSAGSLRVTDDAGRSWRTVPAAGVPLGPLAWLGFSDANHGAVLASLGDTPAGNGLYVTSDGGVTWTKAAFPSGG